MERDSTANGRSKTKDIQDIIFRENDVIKPVSDPRVYRCLLLGNNLKVMLVNDRYLERSVVSLSVHVGTMCDPKEIPGLAHFCEHMVFLGNIKYPQENGFREFLSKNNGVTNAFTSLWNTCYHFSVATEKLIETMDRFAQFFISPLFEQSAIEREVNAVHSEYEKNLTIDSRLKRQTLNGLAVDHPLSSFGCGNVDTLVHTPKSKNINIREELIKFHTKWYSANIMSLVVISRLHLDYLEEHVVQIFSNIPDKNIAIPSWNPDPFHPNYYETKLKIVPIKDIRTLTMHFKTVDLVTFFKSAPESYISHLIGHEAKGSILSELKSLGWSNTLSVDHENLFLGFGFFEIQVDLTEEGLNHVDDIILLIFQYIKLLEQEGPQKWIFDEICYINEVRFQFREKEAALTLVHYLQYARILYPFKEVLRANYFRNEWSPSAISTLLKELNSEKCIFSIVSQRFRNEANKVEPYYKAKYSLEKISPKILKRWNSCQLNPNLLLPYPNQFLAKNLIIHPAPTISDKLPKIINDDETFKLWHFHETKLRKPKCGYSFLISKNIFDPTSTVFNQVMIALVKDDLIEISYDASVAGMGLKIRPRLNGLVLNIEGYSEKQTLFLHIILDHIFNFKVKKQRFHILKDNFIRDLKNKETEMPAELAFYYSFLILSEYGWSHQDKLKVIESVTLDRLQQFIDNYFKSVYIEGLLFGNITFEQAKEIKANINHRLLQSVENSLPPLKKEDMYCREHRLNIGERFLFTKETIHHSICCIYLYFQCARQSDQMNIIAELFEQIVREPCFTTLRTEEQLGYIIHSGSRKSNGSIGFHIIVQSSHHPSYVEERINSFLEKFQKTLKNMDERTFGSFKKSLLRRKYERYSNFYEKNKGLWNEILLGEYHFERGMSEASYLEKYRKDDVINFFETFIGKNAKGRKNLTIYIISTEISKNAVSSISSQYVPIFNLNDLKIRNNFYPIPTAQI